MSQNLHPRLVIIKFLNSLAYFSFILLGKGYGTSTVSSEVKAASRFLPKIPKYLIDVGGNKGEYTSALRKQYPNSEIHIFEPSKENIKLLQNRFEKDSKIAINPKGLSDHAGVATLFADESGSGMGSLQKRRLDHFEISFDFSESVELITFQEYWKTNLNKEIIDFIKIDIEGHELSALKGFGEALNNCRLIQFEFGGCNIDTRTYFQDFWYFFIESNFKLYRISPLGTISINKYSEFDETFSTTNYLAVNQAL